MSEKAGKGIQRMLDLRMADITKRSQHELEDRDRATLDPRGWLNDEIMNKESAQSLIDSERSDMFVVSTLFTHGIEANAANDDWAVKSGIDFCQGSVKMLLMPVHVGESHWVLFVVNMKRNILTILDPKGIDTMYKPQSKAIAKTVASYIDKQRAVRKCLSKPMAIGHFYGIPTQNNDHDCGMYVLVYIDEILGGSALRPKKIQDDIDRMRASMRTKV